MLRISEYSFQAFDSILQFDKIPFKTYLSKIRKLLSLLIFQQRSTVPGFLASKLPDKDVSFDDEKSTEVPYFESYHLLIREFKKLMKQIEKRTHEWEEE